MLSNDSLECAKIGVYRHSHTFSIVLYCGSLVSDSPPEDNAHGTRPWKKSQCLP